MPDHPTVTGPSEKTPPSFGLGSFLFALLFALLTYILIASMVRHHFFKGGHPNRSMASSTAGDWKPGPFPDIPDTNSFERRTNKYY